jgi:hypothetical protein
VRVVNNVVKRNDVRSRLYAAVQGEGYPEAFMYKQKVRWSQFGGWLVQGDFKPSQNGKHTVAMPRLQAMAAALILSSTHVYQHSTVTSLNCRSSCCSTMAV